MRAPRFRPDNVSRTGKYDIMSLDPREAIPHNLTTGQRRRLKRDAMLYDLIVKGGWRAADIAEVFGGCAKHYQRRIKMFSGYFAERRRG